MLPIEERKEKRRKRQTILRNNKASKRRTNLRCNYLTYSIWIDTKFHISTTRFHSNMHICIYDVSVSSESKKLKKDERLIADGSFDPEVLPHQTFEAQKFDIEGELKHLTCKSVRFEFVNNYGNEDYTCIYRLQVHSGNNDKYAEDNVKILKTLEMKRSFKSE
ncbi:MAG: hypothetical protein EZS28_044677 [Streblomastix strix]|uniref:SUN domain-containing protein n=1 Tax=Streblomastix strix TaxID=222440 RepID=A0A5J4TNK5_9EUKA|nr:MAG: hypothetical protein EZS28_044677 [Streblomastix strix]